MATFEYRCRAAVTWLTGRVDTSGRVESVHRHDSISVPLEPLTYVLRYGPGGTPA